MGCAPAAGIWHLSADPDASRAFVAASKRLGPVRNPIVAYEMVEWWFARYAGDQEVAAMLHMDTHGYARGMSPFARGARDRVAVNLIDAYRAAVMAGTRYNVLFHNHPTGDARPSSADAQLTKDAGIGASYVDLYLIDHMVIGLDQFYSFRTKELYRANAPRRAQPAVVFPFHSAAAPPAVASHWIAPGYPRAA